MQDESPFMSSTTAPATPAVVDTRAPETEPWPGQLRRRRIELGLVEPCLPSERVERILEIGCGNAIGSALLKDRARLLVATDLPKVDVTTHSIGMSVPRQLLQTLRVDNCRL